MQNLKNYLARRKNNDPIHKITLFQQTGGKRFNLKDDTDLSERLIKYIYELSESEELPEIENKYPMILSTGLEYVKLAAPITIEYFYAYSEITADNHSSSKFSEYADTDGDGLYDFEEIDFSSQIIKTDDGRVELPTIGECLDYYGSRYFYVEGGLDRYLNYAGYVELIDTKVLPIRSNPTKSNTDDDSYTDYEEIFTYESDPLVFTYLIEKESVDFLLDSDNFGAEIYREFYGDDDYSWLTKASV